MSVCDYKGVWVVLTLKKSRSEKRISSKCIKPRRIRKLAIDLFNKFQNPTAQGSTQNAEVIVLV